MRSEERRRDTRRKKKNNYLTAKEKIKSEEHIELQRDLEKEVHRTDRKQAKAKLLEQCEFNASIEGVFYKDKLKAETEADKKEAESWLPLIWNKKHQLEEVQKRNNTEDKLEREDAEKMVKTIADHQGRMRNVHQHNQFTDDEMRTKQEHDRCEKLLSQAIQQRKSQIMQAMAPLQSCPQIEQKMKQNAQYDQKIKQMEHNLQAIKREKEQKLRRECQLRDKIIADLDNVKHK
jgi:hypothetical protein